MVLKLRLTHQQLINQEEIQTIRELLKKGIEADEEEDKLYGEKLEAMKYHLNFYHAQKSMKSSKK
jgi:predicted RNA binding protein with dsRBD fold (UPF0201 family)